MAETTGNDNNERSAGDNAAALRTFTERTINASLPTWQALAAVIDGMDDEEAEARLEALNPEELRVFHFQLDRIRTLTRNVRFRKMKAIEEQEKLKHEAAVKRPDGEGS